MHSELAKLRREMDALRAQLQAATDEPCMSVRIRRVTESGEIVTTVSGDTAGPGHTCSDNCKALIIGLAEDPEASDFRERLAQRVAREVKAHSGGGAQSQASLERTRMTCAFYGVPFPEVAERPCADASGGSAASTEGADARSGARGDAQPSPERASAESTPEPTDEAPRAPEPAYGPEEGRDDALPGGRARDAVVEMGRTAPPALVSPLALEMQREADARAAALSRDVQSRAPWWLPVAEAPLGPCAVPYCGHPALEHRGPRTRLPCRVCGFRAEQHDPDGIALEVPYASRRATPCVLYRAICVDEEDSDGCEREGCGCPGWRRVPPYVSEHEARLRAFLDEKDRIAAEQAAELDRLRAQYEEAERAILRAQGPNPLGPSPHSVPVFEGESR